MSLWERFDQLFERLNALCDDAWKLADELEQEPGETTTTTTTRTEGGVTTITTVTRKIRVKRS